MSDTPTKTYPPEFLQRLVDDHEAEQAGATPEASSAVETKGDAMSDIERFDIRCLAVNKRENGDWVRYDDHRAEVERLKALIICLSRPIEGDSAWVLEDEENEAIATIWREKEQRDAHDVAAKGGRDE